VILLRLVALIMAPLFFSGCSYLGALTSMLPGGGDGVAANVQAGQENTQAVISSEESDSIETGDHSVVTTTEASRANHVSGTQINNELPDWVLLLLILGWVLPGPTEIWRGLVNASAALRCQNCKNRVT